jgi:hypothetical protein
MKSHSLPIAIALAATLSFIGCNKAGKLSEHSKSLTPPSGPVQLTEKWPVGEHIVKRIAMKMDNDISVPNQPPIKQQTSIGQRYGLSVKNGETTAGRMVEMEFLSMAIKVDQAGKTVVDYDSEAKTSGTPGDQTTAMFQKVLQPIIGTKLRYFINATNGLDRVEGIDEMIQRFSADGQNPAAGSMKNMFNEAYLREMIGDSRYLPPTPVQPSDSWPVNMDVNLGDLGILTISNTVTLSNWEQHGPRLCARLDFDGTFTGKPAQNGNKTGMGLNIQSGTLSGSSWFDPELGMTIDSTVNQDLNLTMKVPANPQAKMPAQTIKMLMHQLINVKLDSVK